MLYSMDMNYNVVDEKCFHQKFSVCETCGLKSITPIEYGEQESKKGQKVPTSIRTSYVMHYVKTGKGHFTINKKTYPVSAGDIFIIPPYKKVSYAANDSDPWSYAWIRFTFEGDSPEFLSSPVLTFPAASNVFEEMREALYMESSSLYLTYKLYKLFLLLGQPIQNESDCIDQALTYIHAKINTNIKVSELAEKFGYNRAYFSSLFTKKVGVSPQQYMLKLRMETAAELMIIHNQKPILAAQTVGYIDFYLFSKMFKKYFGISPTEYIKKNNKS